jgi:DedD protein
VPLNMAFFKFRKKSDDPQSPAVQPESVEAMRSRAKYRLIGSVVLVLAGVIGFPLLFDKQPRPISVDMPIEIPDKNKVKPLIAPAPVETPVVQKAPAPVVSAPLAAPPVPAPVPPKVVQPPKAVAKPSDGAKVQALLEGHDSTKKSDAVEGRFVVQVGAFADANRAREVRLRMEHAGLKTYTHVAETKEGPRIRVRVGPFSVKADAEKAAQKIKKLDLPASVLTL